MIGMDTNYITDRIKNMIINYKIGGVILYRKKFFYIFRDVKTN